MPHQRLPTPGVDRPLLANGNDRGGHHTNVAAHDVGNFAQGEIEVNEARLWMNFRMPLGKTSSSG